MPGMQFSCPALRRLGCHWPLATVALLVALTGTAQAERADRNQPMNAEADALRYDDARQVSVFTGNVVITKGSIVIRGQQVEVRQDPQGNQFGTVQGSAAARAFFRQKREGVDEHIEGEAQRIDYDGEADTVRFSGQAVLRRYKGSVLNDETSGSLIVYDNRSEVFTVDGGAANRSTANPSGRVRAMLTPTPKPEASGNKPGGSKPAASPDPSLKASPTLEPRQ